MALVDVNKLNKAFGIVELFNDLSFKLNNNEKLAIIGPNGCGKTTLLKMLIGQETIDAGTIIIRPKTSVGYLSQMMLHSLDNSLYQEMLGAFEEVIKLGKKLKKISEELSKNPHSEKLLKDYGLMESAFLEKGGYNYEYQIDTILSKFGFTKADYSRKIGTFSGGERNKNAFSRLLLDAPDLLLLDEPTNHLDVSTVEWLEGYLKNYAGAIILVSHDRYFIDAICGAVLEINNKQAEYYSGNYSFYLQEKVLRYEQRLKAYNLQQKEIEHLTMLIKKFKPKPSKVAFAKDKEKKLARILNNKLKAPKKSSKSVRLNFQVRDTRKQRQMTLSALEFGYEKPLAAPLDLAIFGGDKIGIIGENGIGKTTLLKTIGKKLEPLAGSIRAHRELAIGYIDQNQIQLTSEATLFDYVHDQYPLLSNFEIRSHLASFLFSGDDVFKTVNQLSGGEKVLLSFASLLLKKYDLLLLDEPTNHMDIETRKILESALVEYSGTIIFVSHDRYFIDELAKKLIILKRKDIQVFEGDYSEYQSSLENLVVEPVVTTKTKRVSSKRVRGKEKVEQEIKKIEKEIAEVLAAEYLEENYLDYKKMEKLAKTHLDLKQKLQELESEYLQILEESETKNQ